MFHDNTAKLENDIATTRFSPDVPCEFTDDKTKLAQADAVIIFPRGISSTDLPMHANREQNFVFLSAESPHAMYYEKLEDRVSLRWTDSHDKITQNNI